MMEALAPSVAGSGRAWIWPFPGNDLCGSERRYGSDKLDPRNPMDSDPRC
ncbi:hypothetical protein ACNKHV_11515 [Shigella flexneri]